MSAEKTKQKVDVNSREYHEKVYQIVRRIPPGRVMTYGQIADMLGEGYTARTVGFVMYGASEENVPWQRVINARGACSTGRVVIPPDKQQRLLEAEGIIFNNRGQCDLAKYRWTDEDGHPVDSQPTLFSD
jgi:methylated-DNA-protein-cysteine methyltransferase-like protein